MVKGYLTELVVDGMRSGDETSWNIGFCSR